MNKVAAGATALVVVAGGGVGFGAWSGGKVAKELQTQTTTVLAPFQGVKVVENSVSTGLFSSTHTVTLDIGCAPVDDGVQPAAEGGAAKPVQITWRDHVRHGPLPGLRSVGLATIDTELVLSPEAQAQVAKLFGDQAPVRAHTVLGFGGNYVSEVTSPAFKYAEAGKGDVDWQGLRATVRGKFTSDGMPGAGTYVFEAPGLAMNFAAEGQAAGTLRLGRMSFEGSVTPQAGSSYLLSPSQGQGAIASLALTTTPPGGKPVDVLFENLAFASESRIDAGLWAADTSLSMKGRVDDFPIDQVEMKVSLKRLHAATYEQLIGRVMKSSFSCKKPGDAGAMQEAMALQADMMKDAGALLVHNPEYAVDRFAVVIGGKTAELSYRFGTKGITEADAALPLPALMTTKGYADAAFKVENAWIEQVVKKAVSMKPAADGSTPEEAAADAMAAVRTTLDQLASQGLVAREGDTVVSKAAFEGGMLKVNGQPLNVPLGMIGR
jgi:uncharacterized protein YdgA (DUF945 family)